MRSPVEFGVRVVAYGQDPERGVDRSIASPVEPNPHTQSPSSYRLCPLANLVGALARKGVERLGYVDNTRYPSLIIVWR
jgi:hypothetical protein